ncbi:MAG: DUF4230 domain-containing protein [Treponema sp.]|nr:DUF4230 domain-containing protein [Treponema sp.]
MKKNNQNSEKSDKPAKAPKPVKIKVPFFKKIIVRLVWIIILALIFAGASYYAIHKLTKVETESRHAMVDKQLSFCQELVTAKYRYSDIVTLKKSSGFAKSYSIIKYTGLLRVGIADFTDISYNISLDGKTIKLKMPAAEILGNDLVKQDVFDEKDSIFVPISTQEIFDEIDQARIQTQEDLVAEGILEDAELYAQQIIRQFLLALGFEKIVFE